MRRHHTASPVSSAPTRRFLAPVALTVAAALLVTGCSSSSAAKKTVYETVVASSSSGAAGSSGASSTAVTVPGGESSPGSSSSAGGSSAQSSSSGAPSSSAEASSSGASSSAPSSAPSSTVAPSSTSEPTATGGPIVKVNPLNIDCARILTAADVKRVLNQTINNTSTRTKFGAQANINSTGAIRCAYGIVSGQQKASLRVTQYKTVQAADAQVKVTVDSETGLGAKVSSATVGGQPANVMLRAGGLINVRYGTWVLAVAAADGTLSGNQAAQMTALGDLVLKRILATA